MFETVNDTLNSYFYNISISQNSSFKVIFIEIKMNIVFSFSDSEAISVSNTLQYTLQYTQWKKNWLDMKIGL